MQLICDAEALFTAHNTVDAVAIVVLLLQVAEDLAGEHPVPVVLRENCVATDVLVSVRCNSISLIVRNVVHGLFPSLRWGLLISGRADIVIGQRVDEVLSTLVVGELDFVPFVQVSDLLEEHFQKAFLSLNLDLRDDDSAIDLEVVARVLSGALTEGHACLALVERLLGPDNTLDSVALVARSEFSELCGGEERVDVDRLLVLR